MLRGFITLESARERDAGERVLMNEVLIQLII